MSRRKRRNRLPQEPVVMSITGLSHDGKGVAKVNDKTVFVAGALPGEDVRARYSKTRRHYDEAVTVEVLEASPNRIAPQCAYFMHCGGCSLQHLDSTQQILAKQEVLLENFQRLAKVSPENIAAPLTDMPWGYRRKARLGVRVVDKKGGTLVGFRELGSNFLTVMDSCEVLDARVGQRIAALRSMIDSLSIRQAIAQIEVAADAAHCVLVFRHLEPVPEQDHKVLDAFGKATQLSIYLQSGGPETITPLNDAHQVQLHYDLHLSPMPALRLHFTPSHFTQVNMGLNQKMVAQALAWLDIQAEDHVLDLFCGLGNFTLPIAQLAAQVLGVEGSAQLVADAKENAADNQLENASFVAMDLQDNTAQAAWMQQRWDKVLLDPPRSGALEMMPVLGALAPKSIVYVSCNPATLARDAAVLVHEYGYRCVQAGVMDMFPHTGHVESIALFCKP